MWLFFVLALINGLSIYINFQGNGLSSYSVSFSSYLIQTTLGIVTSIKVIIRDPSSRATTSMQLFLPQL